MAKATGDFSKEMEEAIDRAMWQGEVCGKIEGALNVLFALDLEKDKRLELLCDAVGLSSATAEEFLEPRQIEENILKNKKLLPEEKNELLDLIKKEALNDPTVLKYPVEALKSMASITGNGFIEKAVPQARKWVKDGEEVSLRKVKDWLIKKYHLL